MTKATKTHIRPAIKIHGGKYYLSDFVVSHFPEGYEGLTYCEPMCGGASVFLNKERSTNEVISDIDLGLVRIYKSLRDEPKEFVDRLKRLKYNEQTFAAAAERAGSEFADYLDHAVNEYTLRRMSRGGMKKAFAWSERQRGGQPGDVNAWETMLRLLPRIAERMKDTTILNESVFEVIKFWDDESTLIYLDPPYMPETRAEGSTQVYEHELTVEDHIDLLTLAKGCKGKVLISGYASPLYNRMLKGWKVRKKEMPNHAGQSKKKERRVEVLWMNYEVAS